VYFELTHHIEINGVKLLFLEKAIVKKSLNLLSDTAEIHIAGMSENITMQVKEKVKRGDKVSIALGYDNENSQELVGYVTSVKMDDKVIIHCEDRMFEFNKEVSSVKFKEPSVIDILNKLLADLEGFTLVAGEGVSDIRFSEFTIADQATAYQVLVKLKEQTGLNFYLRGQELHVQLRHFSDKTKVVKYDFTKNVEKSSLSFVNEEDQNLLVTVTSLLKDGGKLIATAGKAGGDKLNLKRWNIKDQKTLDAIANEYYKDRAYTGLHGTITTWLLPSVTVGMYAQLIDDSFQKKEGTYLIETETVEFSANGGVRKLGLGVSI